MKLSIHVFIDWFGDKVKDSRCTSGNMSIEGIRLYSKTSVMRSDIMYIGTSNDFFSNGNTEIVCINQNDYITLDSHDLIECVNSAQDAIYYYTQWYQKCRDLIHNDGNIDELLALTLEIFPSPIILVDAAQTFIAMSMKNAEFQNSEEWKQAQERGSISESYLRNYNLAHPEVYNQRHVFAVEPEYFFVKGYCKHVFINGARRASVILKVTGSDYSKGKLQIFDCFSELVKEWINSSGENGNKFHVRSYFAKALEGDEDSVSAMIRQTVLFGWDEKCLKALFLIRQTKENAVFDMRMVSNITNEAEGRYAIIYKDQLVILTNNSLIDHPAFNNNLNNFIKKYNLVCAVSFSFTNMKLLNQAYLIANAALDNNPIVPGVLYHSQDTSIRRIAKIINEQAASTLDHPILQMLSSYDRNFNTDYYITLFSYLKNERRQQAAADELFIHRNTLTQRLSKIQEIWHLDLENPDERFHILFSYYERAYSDNNPL